MWHTPTTDRCRSFNLEKDVKNCSVVVTARGRGVTFPPQETTFDVIVEDMFNSVVVKQNYTASFQQANHELMFPDIFLQEGNYTLRIQCTLGFVEIGYKIHIGYGD